MNDRWLKFKMSCADLDEFWAAQESYLDIRAPPGCKHYAESLFDTYSLDFYDESAAPEMGGEKNACKVVAVPPCYSYEEYTGCDLDHCKFSPCADVYIRPLNLSNLDEHGNIVYDDRRQFFNKLKNETTIYFRKSERTNFTFTSVAKNYTQFLTLLRKNKFYRKSQKEFPDCIMYERKITHYGKRSRLSK